MCDFEDVQITNKPLKSKTLAEQQKELAELLSQLGFAPMDEHEEIPGVLMVTRYEKFGMAVIIERNL